MQVHTYNSNKSRRYKKETNNSNSTPMNKSKSVRISRIPNTTDRISINIFLSTTQKNEKLNRKNKKQPELEQQNSRNQKPNQNLKPMLKSMYAHTERVSQSRNFCKQEVFGSGSSSVLQSWSSFSDAMIRISPSPKARVHSSKHTQKKKTEITENKKTETEILDFQTNKIISLQLCIQQHIQAQIHEQIYSDAIERRKT